MSFWDLNDGGNAADTGSEYEVPGGGNFDPIPDGSSVLALIDEAVWDQRTEAEYISLRWSILAPEEYKNRKVFQKLWVTDLDPNAQSNDKALKKRDRARRMLAAIDANAGGGLTKDPGVPTDEALQANLMNRPMVIRLGLWSMPDRNAGAPPGAVIEGNWVQAVAPSDKPLQITEAKPRQAAQSAPASVPSGGSYANELDDEIPF